MKNVHRINGKIYITNNQELRHGFDQCYLNKEQNRPIISQRPQYVYDECLIVLTDDEYLINDGIQSIDGKSLEWLVENKRCEYVNIEHTFISREFDKPAVIFHKIILPKGEPKQDCCTPIGQIKRYKDCIGCDRKPRQETLEEAVKVGAKWQQQQNKKLYSEEEVLSILDIMLTEYRDSLNNKTDFYPALRFEQFKKKNMENPNNISAVDWYSDKLLQILGESANNFTIEQTLANRYALKQANEIFKQQVISAGNTCALKQVIHIRKVDLMSLEELEDYAKEEAINVGQEYYNETFKEIK